uniref:(northern house mosquito) hypothetical protein n=1 Tax=Culex pipiens TaxID=7175 RepID=A0A8D8D9R0_CULPI
MALHLLLDPLLQRNPAPVQHHPANHAHLPQPLRRALASVLYRARPTHHPRASLPLPDPANVPTTPAAPDLRRAPLQSGLYNGAGKRESLVLRGPGLSRGVDRDGAV